jgi:putative tryptophan/tyrosine transport system substrate-binding protein
MRRRDFVVALGGAAVTWPLAARAQQPEWMLMGLEKRGWTEGRNVRIDYRFSPAGAQIQDRAQGLIALQPDVILAHTTPLVAALQRESSTIPIVFAAVADPVGSGFIASLPHPGRNITGVMQYEASVAGKWLAMLKEIAPNLVRAAFVANPKTASFYDYYLRAGEAPSAVLIAVAISLCILLFSLQLKVPSINAVRFMVTHGASQTGATSADPRLPVSRRTKANKMICPPRRRNVRRSTLGLVPGKA